MDRNNVSSDHVIAKLIELGFEFSEVMEAIEAVGPSVDNAIEFILNGSRRSSMGLCSGSGNSTSNAGNSCKRVSLESHSFGRLRQSSIMDHIQSSRSAKRRKVHGASNASVPVSGSDVDCRHLEEQKASLPNFQISMESSLELFQEPVCMQRYQEIGSDWEQKVNSLLQKHFGFSSLKHFQKEALEAWLAHRDCLVLAATGSGKSLCFQIPALLTGKVVVVISPLISLMHDQCLKLSKHGVSACFLGSGQPDSSVEHRAMSGMYGIIYVCPETLLRATSEARENRGIALFAIDEVHCVSKWGHDFRPDYRRLSTLRENFRASSLHFLKFDIPLMALTATATFRVREDILESLCMSKETKVVLTSFFRPNLRFSVKHSRTTSAKSYEKDFHDLIDTYTREGSDGKRKCSTIQHSLRDEPEISDRSENGSVCGSDELSPNDLRASKDDYFSENEADVSSSNQNDRATIEGNQLSVEYLEDELDAIDTVDDLDGSEFSDVQKVSCGEFLGHSAENTNIYGSPEIPDQPFKQEQQNYQEGPLEKGPTIIYMPTRKETLRLAHYLCRSGVKAAAYNAKLPKSHLRQVHKEFHQNVLQVVVATIAFGMGIDKTNVRRIIHYGWPQSLEAYYQEAGRAGRDGKLADCILYANLARVPTLLPSQRSAEQMKQAYKMLADCFRYGMGTACCRAKTLVEYFGETFSYERCLLCDICAAGPPEMQNLKLEADIFMQVLSTQYGQNSCGDNSFDSAISSGRVGLGEKLDLRTVVGKIREQFPKFSTSDRLWWQGLARILEERGCIKEGDDLGRVCIKYPELTELGLKFLHSETMQDFYAYPEADMLLSVRNQKSFSTFSEWGKGWADPKIRRERLQRKKGRRKARKKNQDWTTVRGRLAAKLSRQK